MREEEIIGLFGGMLGCGLFAGFMLLMVGLALVVWWKIFAKAGYGGAFGLLMLVPLANIVMLLILAFGRWPVLREIEELRRRAAEPGRQL